jgi:hypothetical protein
MANQNLLTYGLKLTQIKQDYYAPTLVFPGATTPAESIYCFLSHVGTWDDDNNPPSPVQDQKTIKDVFKNMFVAKQVTSSNMSPVTQRIDWTSGAIYDYYRDDVDMFAVNEAGFLVKSFYVKNRYDQVFKCLWNNNGAASTDEPFFQPGTYNTNNVFVSGVDGYKWKYMYSIDIGSKSKFMDSTWMPVPLGSHTPNDTTSAGIGSIDVVNVTNGGSGYDVANSKVTVTITGDGSGATANAVVSGGVLTDINVYTPGSNYSYANVIIDSSNTQIGSGAVAIAPASPIGGHGYDPASELGCSRIMFSIEFNSSETLNGIDYVPVDQGFDYRQVGLLINPLATDTIPNFANNSIYDLSTQMTVASGFGVYKLDETVSQTDVTLGSPTYGQVVFTGTVLSFNTSTNVVKLINTHGTPIYNSSLTGQTSGTARTLLTVTTPKFIKFSGYIVYIENRSSVQRSADGIEQFKFVLGY